MNILAVAVVFSFALVACGGAAPPKAPAPQVTHAELAPPVACDLVCEAARVVRRPSDSPNYHERATANANAVLAAAHSDILACYRTRLRVVPSAHGFITVAIVVGPDGRVTNVDTTGGAVLGPATMSCIVERIRAATFDPPHGGGTVSIQVPFSLRRITEGEDA